MSRMLKPSDLVSVDEAQFGVDYELCWSATGRLTRYCSSRIWTRVGSVSDMCIVELARIDSGNLRDRTDWSSRMLPSRSEPGSVPNIYMPNADYWNRFFWTDSAPGDCSDERDGSNWSSRMSISRMKRELGLLSWDRSAPSGYNGQRAAFRNLFGCRLTEWSTIVSMLHKKFHLYLLRSRMQEYNQLTYSKRKWSNTVRCKPRFSSSSLFSVSSRYKTEKQNVVIRKFGWRSAAGWRTSKLWY